jgi:hypothetical protein
VWLFPWSCWALEARSKQAACNAACGSSASVELSGESGKSIKNWLLNKCDGY